MPAAEIPRQGSRRALRLAGWALVLALLMPAWAAAQGTGSPESGAQERTVQMTLLPLAGETVLYRGVRTIRAEAGRVAVTTVYSDAAGETIQRTEGTYEAGSLAAVSYRLHDLRSGEEETLEREGASVRMSYRARADAEPDRDTVDWEDGMQFTATVEALILRAWQRLVAGESVAFRLLVPSRQDVFRFRLQRDSDGPAPAAGRVRVRMEPDTWLVRRLVDPLFFLLDEAPPHRLREFRGRSSIRTASGETQDLRIVYAYPEEG